MRIIIKTEFYKQSQSSNPSDLNTQPGDSGSPSGLAYQMFPSEGDSNSEQSVIKNWNKKKKKKKKKTGIVPKNSL